MSIPNNCRGLYSAYQTEKSETSELVMVGPHGIISFKIVVSQNGKKTQVFSGFDPAAWQWGQSALGTLSDACWEHRYVESQERQAKKYGVPVLDLEPGNPVAIVQSCGEHAANHIERAYMGDEKVQTHWRMFHGDEAGVSSARGADRTPQPPKAFVKAPTKSAITRERMKADDGYGVF